MKYLVANWKMKLTIAESTALARQACAWYSQITHPSFTLILCPSSCAISAVADVLRGSKVELGAQDVAECDRASLTGATSPLQLKELGVTTVIVGHSERRAHYGETDALVGKKVTVAFSHGFRTILCVGETLEERAEGVHEEAVRRQVRLGLAETHGGNLMIAYEPVWAIGTGHPVSVTDAQAQVATVCDELQRVWSAREASIPVLYGGSVESGNVAVFTRDPLAGTLVGTASQNPDGLRTLVESLTIV